MPGAGIAGLGWGTEFPTLLATLRKVEEIEVSAISCLADAGGSSGYGFKRW